VEELGNEAVEIDEYLVQIHRIQRESLGLALVSCNVGTELNER